MNLIETIKPPINSKKMSSKDRKKLTYNLNSGNLQLFLEVKDENGNLLGFQEVMTIDDYYDESKKLLNELASLNRELEFSKGSDRKSIFRKINKLNLVINQLKNIKMFMLKDQFSFTEELDRLGSYNKDEMTDTYGKYLKLQKND